MALTWAKALGWRLRRQLLDPVGSRSVEDVVERLGAVPAWPEASTELAIGSRRSGARLGDVAQALARGKVVKVFAFRGATNVMASHLAGSYLAVRASSRMWELPSWESYYGLAPSDWPRFREYVRCALAAGPLTRSELADSLGRSSRYRHLRSIVAAGNDNLLKPLTWQGDIGLGPVRDGEATFLRLHDVPGWAGIPDLDDAGPTVIAHYLGTYGPASQARVHDWFGKGLGARRRDIKRWLGQLEGRCAQVTMDGDRALLLRQDLEEVQSSAASSVVRLLPGRDPWLMAPGTSDARVVTPARREAVSRSANLVVSRGVLAGTWSLRAKRVDITWFGESGRVPRTALDEQTARLATLLDRPLDPAVSIT